MSRNRRMRGGAASADALESAVETCSNELEALMKSSKLTIGTSENPIIAASIPYLEGKQASIRTLTKTETTPLDEFLEYLHENVNSSIQADSANELTLSLDKLKLASCEYNLDLLRDAHPEVVNAATGLNANAVEANAIAEISRNAAAAPAAPAAAPAAAVNSAYNNSPVINAINAKLAKGMNTTKLEMEAAIGRLKKQANNARASGNEAEAKLAMNAITGITVKAKENAKARLDAARKNFNEKDAYYKLSTQGKPGLRGIFSGPALGKEEQERRKVPMEQAKAELAKAETLVKSLQQYGGSRKNKKAKAKKGKSSTHKRR